MASPRVRAIRRRRSSRRDSASRGASTIGRSSAAATASSGRRPIYGPIAALGYQQVTNIDQSNNLTPDGDAQQSVPERAAAAGRQRHGLLTGVGGPITFNNQDRQSEYLQQYSFDLQRQLPGNMAVAVGYIGHARRRSESTARSTSISCTPDIVAQWGSRLNDQVPNPFFGIADAGAFSTNSTISRGQLLRPFPQFGNVLQDQTTGARTRYHAVTAKLDKRAVGVVERQLPLHVEPTRYRPVRRGQPVLHDGAADPAAQQLRLEAEYSRSLQDVPHRTVLSPIDPAAVWRGPEMGDERAGRTCSLADGTWRLSRPTRAAFR